MTSCLLLLARIYSLTADAGRTRLHTVDVIHTITPFHSTRGPLGNKPPTPAAAYQHTAFLTLFLLSPSRSANVTAFNTLRRGRMFGRRVPTTCHQTTYRRRSHEHLARFYRLDLGGRISPTGLTTRGVCCTPVYLSSFLRPNRHDCYHRFGRHFASSLPLQWLLPLPGGQPPAFQAAALHLAGYIHRPNAVRTCKSMNAIPCLPTSPSSLQTDCTVHHSCNASDERFSPAYSSQDGRDVFWTTLRT